MTHNSLDTLADIEAFESVPLSDRLPYDTTWGLFEDAVAKYPDQKALSFLFFGKADEEPRSWTYRELFADLTRSANLFARLGVSETSPLSIVLPNLPESHLAIWGSERAGVANPINPLLEPEHMAGIMVAAGAETVITLAPFPQTEVWEKVSEAIQQAPNVKRVLLIDLIGYLPPLQRTAVRLMRKKPHPPRDGVEIIDFNEALAEEASDRLTFDRPISGDTLASLFHTGGTTGVPKLARHTHLNEAFQGWIVGTIGGLDPGLNMLCGLPLFHVNGVVVTGIATFSRGGHVLLTTPQGFRNRQLMQDFWKIVERHKVNLFSGVPTLFAALLDRPIDADVSSLQYAFCGAAPMPPELLNRFQSATGLKILEGYGLTEAGCVSACHPMHGVQKVGSVGMRIPYQPVRIVSLDANGEPAEDRPVGETGALLLKGPNIFPGYTDTAKTRDTFTSDGWLKTGDLARLDEDGYIWLTGRAKDLIIRGGHNIDPSMIEDVLAGHPDVSMAAAVGQPDAYAGELPVAYVQLREGASVTPDTLHDYVSEHIAERAAVPVRIEIMKALPVTAVGKTFKPDLRIKATVLALSNALKEAGLSADVTARLDAKRGLVADVVTTQEQRDGVAEVLGRFAVPVDIAVR